MNENIAIKVNNLTKTYHLYESPKDRLKEALHPLRKIYHHDFDALKSVSFEINKGETVGIIGKNGAGKSTLLKMLTGVLTPTSGDININGKIASLLELGAGFNPEMSGYENIYLNGTIMGFSKEEMDNKVHSIIEFADIGEFIYQPVKMYSSGMFARLAFSVAINVEPDILIVDEALSVGDLVFQSKSMAKMTSMMNHGVTVIFVSHDMHTVKTLCNKAILIDKGQLLIEGDTNTVANKYLELQHLNINDNLEEISELSSDSIDIDINDDGIPICLDLTKKSIELTKISQRYGDNRATILDMKILDKNFDIVTELTSNNEYYVQIGVKFNTDLSSFVAGFSLSSLDGVQQLTWTNAQDNISFPSVKKDSVHVITTKIHMPLKADVYNFSMGIEYPIVRNQQHQFVDIIMNYKPIKVNFESPQKVFASMFRVTGDYSLKEIK